MNSFFKNPAKADLIKIPLFISGIFLSRLPFLSAGFGDDPDAWRMVAAARFISHNLTYAASRKPGYPVVEFFYALAYRVFGANCFIFNLITAILSCLAVYFFMLALKELHCENRYLSASALAFTPVIYINSVNSMDYIWALFFLMASLYFVLRRNCICCAIALGLAQGCRLTSIGVLVPLALLVLILNPRNYKKTALFAITALCTGIICYIPVIYKYGTGFITYYDIFYPPPDLFLRRIVLNVWGWPGAIAIAAGWIMCLSKKLINRKNPAGTANRTKNFEVMIWIMAVIIYLALFVFLPAESGYLIPAVPFFILFAQRIMDGRIFKAVCVVIILSSFIPLGFTKIHDSSIFANRRTRIDRIKFAESIIGFARGIGAKGIFVLGSWFPQTVEQARKYKLGNVYFAYLLDDKKMQFAKQSGSKIYYLPPVRKINMKVHKIDLSGIGEPFFVVIDKNK